MKAWQLRDKMQQLYMHEYPESDGIIRKDISFVPMFDNRGRYHCTCVAGYIPGYKTIYFICTEEGLKLEWGSSKRYTSIGYRRLVQEADEAFRKYAPTRSRQIISSVYIL